MEKPESSDAQVCFSVRKKEEEKLQQSVFVNYKLEEFIYLLDVLDSVHDKVIINQPICNVLQKVRSSLYNLILLVLFESE